MDMKLIIPRPIVCVPDLQEEGERDMLNYYHTGTGSSLYKGELLVYVEKMPY